MVSMADLQALSGDGFDDVFSSSSEGQFRSSPARSISPTKEQALKAFSPLEKQFDKHSVGNGKQYGIGEQYGDGGQDMTAWEKKKLAW